MRMRAVLGNHSFKPLDGLQKGILVLMHMNCCQLSNVSAEHWWHLTCHTFIHSFSIVIITDSGRSAERVAQLVSHHSQPHNCDGKSRKHGFCFHPVYRRLRGATVISYEHVKGHCKRQGSNPFSFPTGKVKLTCLKHSKIQVNITNYLNNKVSKSLPE